MIRQKWQIGLPTAIGDVLLTVSPQHMYSWQAAGIHPTGMLFLGGLSLRLNHLIGSRMKNHDWPFGILDFFGQIWTQGTLRYILGSILVIFEICEFLMIPGLFEYFSENGWSQKIKVFLMKEQLLPPYWFSFRRSGP